MTGYFPSILIYSLKRHSTWRALNGHLAFSSHAWSKHFWIMINHLRELFSRPIEHISQIFISYGRKSNGELLLSYGFVPREGTSPRDSVELSLSLRESNKCYREKLEALKKHGLSASQRFPLQITGWPVEVMAYAYLAVSPPSMRNQFDQMAAAASNKNTSSKDPRYTEIEEDALQFVLDTCEASISKYSKFLEASGSMDLDVTNPKLLNLKLFLKQLAIDLCTSERWIFFRAQYDESWLLESRPILCIFSCWN